MAVAQDKPFVAREYWEKRLSEKWSLEGVGHICYGQPFNEWAYRMRKKVFLRQVCALPLDFRQVSVLDVGSGTGFWLEVWRSLGVRALTGVDLTEVAVRKLREKYPDVQVMQQDISDPKALPGKTGQFDVISVIDVLYHITKDRDYRQAISNIAALLKPNGYFIFSENLVHCKTRQERHWVTYKQNSNLAGLAKKIFPEESDHAGSGRPAFRIERRRPSIGPFDDDCFGKPGILLPIRKSSDP